MSWTVAAAIACLCFAGHYLTLRAAAGKLPDLLGGFVLETAAALGLGLLYWLLPRGSVALTSAGVLWSALSGLFIVGGVTFLFVALRLGGPVSGTGTIALGGGVALASLMAPMFFAEPMSFRRGLGIAMALSASALFASEK